MRIGAEARAAGLLAVVRELFLGEPALEERARVDAGRGMRLEEHEVAAAAGRGGAEEVVEPDLEDLGRGRVARDVAAEFARGLVGAHHHGQRVPAHDRGEALLERDVARDARPGARAGSCCGRRSTARRARRCRAAGPRPRGARAGTGRAPCRASARRPPAPRSIPRFRPDRRPGGPGACACKTGGAGAPRPASRSGSVRAHGVGSSQRL